MKCVNPRRVPNKNPRHPPYDSFVLTSCGKCYACLSNRRRNWLFRLQNENLDSMISVFATFTYADEYYDGKVHKEHLQKFFKSLRHYFCFSYYCIGEYGTNTLRGHYHGVFFIKDKVRDFAPLDYLSDLFNTIWAKGNVRVSRASYRRLNYVLHYHTRPKQVGPPELGLTTFCLFSKNLGISFLNPEYLRFLISNPDNNLVHDFNGNVYVIPRYYRKKIKGMVVSCPEGNFVFPDGSFSSDVKYQDSLFFKSFGKHLYDVPTSVWFQWFDDLIAIDKKKLSKYNKQDKYY